MRELLNNLSSVSIGAILLVATMLAVFTGVRAGKKHDLKRDEELKSQVNSVQAAFLGLFSFLLAFSFGMALHHFDSRSEAMKEEANAIGTAYLRASALPDSVRETTQAKLKRYIDLRVQASEVSLNSVTQRDPILTETGKLTNELWGLAMKSVKDDDRVVTSGLYSQALGNVFDAFGTRDELLNRSIPTEVIVSLMITLVLWAGTIGYSSGISASKLSPFAVGFIIAVVMLMSMVVDLDRPRRGMIQVNQKNMLDLQTQIKGE